MTERVVFDKRNAVSGDFWTVEVEFKMSVF